MRYTEQMTLNQKEQQLSPKKIPTGIIRKGDLDEPPVITWLLDSLWVFKRQGMRQSILISCRK